MLIKTTNSGRKECNFFMNKKKVFLPIAEYQLNFYKSANVNATSGINVSM